MDSDMHDSQLNATCTRAEVTKFMAEVAYQLAAPAVAHKALSDAVKAVGWDGMDAAIKQPAPPAAPTSGAAATKAKGKGKKAKGEDTEEKDKDKEKKPRKLTAFNVFNMMMMDMVAKDPSNPAFKAPTTTDDQGNVVKSRGGHMSMIGGCWKALGEDNHKTFTNLIQEPLDEVNDVLIKDGQKPENVVGLIQERLKSRNQYNACMALINKGIETSTGHKAGDSAATPSKTKAEPVEPQANGSEKKRKKAAEEDKETKKGKKAKEEAKEEAKPEKESKDKKKKEKKEEAARKEREAAAAKKAAEEEAARKAAAAKQESSEESSDDSSDEESSDE